MQIQKSGRYITIFLISIITICLTACEQQRINNDMAFVLKQKLNELAEESENTLLTQNFNSIKAVIDAERSISTEEAEILENMYMAFLNDTLANPSIFESYLNRERTLIIAWESPTDGKTSFSWLRLPKDWDPEIEYPLYVHLHGFWDVAAEPISYMGFTFNVGPSTTTAFEDGYWLSPWGRGNKWYEGISKTDIWEAIDELESQVKIDSTRKYLSGHSMGGYGTWNIAKESSDNWAAIGIHSGALFYNNSKLVTQEYADRLSNTPTYFVWGTNEEARFHESNEEAIKLLRDSGNQNVEVAMFEGGHDYNESDVETMYKWLRTFSND